MVIDGERTENLKGRKEMATTYAIEESAMELDTLIADKEVTDKRRGLLRRAIELGADDARLRRLRDAMRASDSETIVLPAHRFEGLSRGRGWARKGRGADVKWGTRVEGGYAVAPGLWSVGATDGFSRKRSNEWKVEHITIGAETWTIAN
jgi:hypothetical protein